MVIKDMDLFELYHEPCLEAMSRIPDGSVDMIFADLPYGKTKCEWDIVIPLDLLWEKYKRIIKTNGCILLFGDEPFSSYLRMSNTKWYRYDWYWQKERLTNIFQVKHRPGKVVENICVFYKKQPVFNPQKDIYLGVPRTNKIKNGKLGSMVDSGEKTPKEYSDDGTRYPIQLLKFQRDCLTSNIHPTQKPVALLEYLIRTYTNDGEVVLDNVMGSGSCGEACANTGRRFIGMEKYPLPDKPIDKKENPNYFFQAEERINAAYERNRDKFE